MAELVLARKIFISLQAVRDVEGFLGKLQRETLALWSGWFFEKKIEHLTQKNVGE